MLKKLKKAVVVDKKLVKKVKIAIVRPDYHKRLNDNLEKYCRKTLLANGVQTSQIESFVVPGSWEIPLMVQKIAKSGKFDAIVAFGIIVKGETHHFTMISNEVGRTLMQLSLDCSIPIAFEVLAVYDLKHAKTRAGNDDQNKGIEGATAVLKMIKALQTV